MAKSTLPPHAANTWVNCPGSVRLCAEFPALPNEERNQSQLDGRASHEVAAKILKSFQGEGGLVTKPHVIGTISTDGVVIDDEIYDNALTYSNDVLRVCNELGAMRNMQVEQQVDMSWLLDGMYGVIDCNIWHPGTMSLYVWEYKYGHRYVSEFENWQLILYVATLLENLHINGALDQQITVHMRVCQPRCFDGDGPIREWVINAAELRGYINQLREAAEEAVDPDARCKTNEHCITCDARYGCRTLDQAASGAMEYINNASGTMLNGHNLGMSLMWLQRAAELVKSRLSGLEEQAISELRSGQTVTGYTAEQGYGRERWTKGVPTDEIIMMGDMLGIDVRKPIELDTPAQVRKKGLDDSVISAYSEKPLTSMKLKRINDAKARQAFKPQ